MPIGAIGRVERRQIHLLDGVNDKPCEVALRQPLANIRWHQEDLLAITRDEVLGHHQMVLKPAGQQPFYATASRESGSKTTKTVSVQLGCGT